MKYSARLLPFFVVLAVLLAMMFNRAQAQDGAFVEPKMVSVPTVAVPDAASKSGLGGIVKVAVRIDKLGNVTAVDDVIGPDGICPRVDRPDVVALRAVSIDAAKHAKFVPAESGGKPRSYSAWLKFDFPRPAPKKEFMVTQPDGRVEKHPVTVGGQLKGGGVLNGKALSLPKPPYPAMARSVRAMGTVSVRAVVDELGDIFSATAVSGHPLLQPSAVLAACKAKYTPTLFHGAPVKVSAIITYDFVP